MDKNSQNISVDDLGTHSVVTEYVDVVNRAIANNSGAVIDKIVEFGDEAIGDRKFGMAVYRDSANSPHDFYTMKFQNGRMNIVSRGKDDPAFTFKASESYLRDVVAEREKYIANPAKLDFEWMKDRAGLT